MIYLGCLVVFVAAVDIAVGEKICEDKKDSATCAFFKQQGLCKQEGIFGDMVRFNCERTCGICHGPTAKPKPTKPTPKPTKAPTQPPKPTKKPQPPPGGCGISPVSNLKGLGIINGHDAKEGAWPWIASIQYDGFSHFCGGTLVNEKWVLTAAHCVKAMTPKALHHFIVVLGAHDFFNTRGQQRRHVKRVIVNPLWNPPKVVQGDTALLELDHPVHLKKRVNLPCMPEEGVYPSLGKTCVLAGWGSIVHPGNPTNLLQQTELPVVEGKNCPVNTKAVCVGKGKGTGPDGKQWPNACRGDSGGPLVCQRKDGRWQLEGVASFVVTYCKYYTGYAPVNQYLSWINSHINQ